ncbi:ABC transporter permease [Enterococcus sp. LJL90]
MKTSNRFIFRKMKNNRGQMLGMGLLIFVAVLFFLTILSFKNSFQLSAENYFSQNHYAPITVTGSFTEDDVTRLSSTAEISKVEPRSIYEIKEADFTYRFIKITSALNQLTVVAGKLPNDSQEIIVLSQFARANQLTVGEKLKINDQEFTISGIASSPEYVYYVQNARTMFADATQFGVIFINQLPISYNQLLIEPTGKITEKNLAEILSFDSYTTAENQINYQMYEGDLGQFETFAVIFPLIFWLISFSIIFILLRRTILKEHKQISIMKALGHSNTTILKIYLFQFGLLGFFAAFLGCLGSIPLSQWLLSMIKIMMELPNLTLHSYPSLWLFACAVSIVGCLLAGLLAIFSVLKELPAASMRPRLPKMTKHSLFERTAFFWQKLSFNSRYAFKSSIRNKGRFLVMVIGISASTALLVFSLGFNDSLHQVTRQYFSDFASYDLVVESEITPLQQNLLSQYPTISAETRALQLPVKVKGEDYSLTITEIDSQLLNLNSTALEHGIILPEYYAEKWHVAVGDLISIDDEKVKVSEIIPLGMGLSIFTSYNYAQKVFPDLPRAYNLTYVKTDQLAQLKVALLRDNLMFSTAEDDITSFDNLLENLQILIWLLIACGVILGITVVACMNLMNLTIREFEYMFMNIMGYSKRKILIAIFKEGFVQLALAIPLGFAAGYFLLVAIKGEFSQNTFALYPFITPTSFIISGVVIFLVSNLRLIMANRFIKRLDIVEGLKIQDD